MPLDGPNLKAEPAATAETDEQAKPKQKKGFPSYLIYVAIAVVMIAAGYFVGTKFLGSASNMNESETAGEEAGAKDEAESEPAATEIINIDDIIVNPAGTGGTRFLAASIGFEVKSKDAIAQFESRMPMIRDALLSILGSKTIEQLSDPKEKEITRYQIKKRVEQLLKTDDLKAVYFTDFVLQ